MKTNLLIFLLSLSVCLLALTCYVEASSSPKVDPRLTLALENHLSKRGDDESPRKKPNAWIFFENRDHSAQERTHLMEELLSGKGHLSAKSLERRRKHSDQVVTEDDFPVSPRYVEEILSTCSSCSLRTTNRWLNAASVSITSSEDVEAIAKLSFVKSVSVVNSFPREEVESQLPSTEPAPRRLRRSVSSDFDYGKFENSILAVNAHLAHREGFNGTGVMMLIIDGGFNKKHPALSSLRVKGQRDFIEDDDDTSDRPEEVQVGTNNQEWHGTAAWSNAAGFLEGQIVGPGFGASFLLAKTEDISNENAIEEDRWVNAVEWGESNGADVLSSSLGYNKWYTAESFDGKTSPASRIASRAFEMGLLSVIAVGNDARRTLSVPADADNILAVGASTFFGTIASFSTRGPTSDGRIKPDVSAPGQMVYAASVVGVAKGDKVKRSFEYSSVNGTSFACPLTAGVVAQVMSAHPEWTVDQVREAIIMTSSQWNAPDNDFGFGIVNAIKAIKYKPEGKKVCLLDCSGRGECQTNRKGRAWCVCKDEFYGVGCMQTKTSSP